MRIILGTDQEMVGNWSRQLEIGDTKRQTERDSSYSQCKSECIHNSTIITMHSITEWQYKTLSHILVSHLISIHSISRLLYSVLVHCNGGIYSYSQHTYMLCALS
jgi:hypothetical protein